MNAITEAAVTLLVNGKCVDRKAYEVNGEIYTTKRAAMKAVM